MFEPRTLRHYQHELDAMLKAAGELQDPEGLADLAALLQAAATTGVAAAAQRQRELQGWSWARYGKAFGISAQAAHKRFGTVVETSRRAIARKAPAQAA